MSRLRLPGYAGAIDQTLVFQPPHLTPQRGRIEAVELTAQVLLGLL